MDYCEKWGKNIEEAVRLALIDMKLQRDQVDVIVLEEPSRGFLGLGAKLAKVRVVKKIEEEKKPEKTEIKLVSEKDDHNKRKLHKEKEEKDSKVIIDEEKQSHLEEVNIEPSNENSKEKFKDRDLNSKAEKLSTKSAKTRKLKEKSSKNKPPRRMEKDEISDQKEQVGSNNWKKKPAPFERNDSDLKVFSKFAVTKEDTDAVEVNDNSGAMFLREICSKMNLSVEIQAYELDDVLFLNVIGKDTGTIIGKRGQTMDALQYLTGLVVNKDREKYMRVIINAESYREKREKTLQQLAFRLSEKVIKTGKNVRLEPMNPYERKVIHSTLQSNSKVTTRSEGEEPYRRIVIELKR